MGSSPTLTPDQVRRFYFKILRWRRGNRWHLGNSKGSSQCRCVQTENERDRFAQTLIGVFYTGNSSGMGVDTPCTAHRFLSGKQYSCEVGKFPGAHDREQSEWNRLNAEGEYLQQCNGAELPWQGGGASLGIAREKYRSEWELCHLRKREYAKCEISTPLSVDKNLTRSRMHSSLYGYRSSMQHTPSYSMCPATLAVSLQA
jgi:hypothetical protein